VPASGEEDRFSPQGQFRFSPQGHWVQQSEGSSSHYPGLLGATIRRGESMKNHMKMTHPTITCVDGVPMISP